MVNNKKPQNQHKFLPILIFILVGAAFMYFGLTFKSGCVAWVPPTCEWWNVFCMANNAIANPGSVLGQAACIAQENMYRLIFMMVGAIIAIVGIFKY